MKTYNVNINTSLLWDISAKAQIRPEAKPKIPYQEIDSLVINLVDSSGNPVNISAYTSFEFSADNNFIHSDALMIYSSSDAGDITILDAVHGKLKISYNANTAKFNTVTSSLTSFVGTPFYVELIGFLAGDADGASLLRDTFYAVPRVKTVEGLPVPSAPLFLNKVQTIALMQSAPQYQFSVDGINFHSTQTLADLFYQVRYDSNGEWSDSIAFIVPTNGIDGQDGLSAYELAVIGGYTGTQAEWILSLKGTDGIIGRDGIDGLDGTNGTDGSAGATGKSAYEVAVLNGFEGNEQAWLLSLHGTNGVDGTDGVTPNFVTGSFTSTDLASNILTITHTNGNVPLPFIIIDDSGKNVTLDNNLVQFLNNQIVIDFSPPYVITGTWRYCFGGSGTGEITGTIEAANINQSASYRLVSDTEKTTWNGKQDALSNASNSASGILTSTDWNTFNGKQDALGFTPENSSNKSTSIATDTGSTTKYPCVAAVETAISTAVSGISTTNLVPNTRTVNGHALTENISVTASDVGLGNVTNTSDSNKPVSTAQQTALDLKQNKNASFNAQTSSYTLVLTDALKIIMMNVASANTLTIPLNSSVAFPVGTMITIQQIGTGTTSIAPASGVTINGSGIPAGSISRQYGMIMLIKTGTNTWTIGGTLI